jgi:methylated-DNA-[protein]-cysteine S-methyltransferase
MYARDHAGIATPIGLVRIEGGDTVTSIRIGAEGPRTPGSAPAVIAAAEQLERWFAGDLREFDLALEPAATQRGQELREGMIAIPFGELLTYGELAQRMGSAARAIGQLCARNPFPIVVPCHRVIGSGGALGHYSGGDGPKTKTWLLDHERRHSGASLL